MNFFIFNSSPHRKYVTAILALVFLPSLGLFLLGIFLQPLYGDLTRIGSYSERKYGWNKPQLEFIKPLYATDHYTGYHDVAVLGDSFSRGRPHHQWQNYIAASTKWSIVTMDVNSESWESVIDSPAYRNSPPKFLILETVERRFLDRLDKKTPCDGAAPPGQPLQAGPEPGKSHDMSIFAKYVDRGKHIEDVKLGFVFNYLKQTLRRGMTGKDYTDVRSVALVKDAPFSSVEKREMLVYKGDFKKMLPEEHRSLAEISCRLERIRARVETNGTTRFILMLAPDKLTAYADLLSDKTLQNISVIKQISPLHPAFIPRIDLVLSAAVRDGVIDVYLPDDTHWGSSGHRLVAESIMAFLWENPHP